MSVKSEERLETQNECSSGERQRYQQQQEKRLIQLKYLEEENRNLLVENDDLQTTLKINKQIIMEFMKSDNPDIMEAIAKSQEENEYLNSKIESLKAERDRLNGQMLLQQQVHMNTKDKDLDIGDIYKEQIGDLKESLERKEYLLQLSEQRSAAFEKLLLNLSGRDPEVQQKIQQQNILLKDRKITNVATENIELKESNQFLTQQNQEMREQLESVIARLSKNQDMGELAEEISIFQNKVQPNVPKVTTSKPIAQNEKVKALRQEISILKKEIDTLKDSNENHIFINEKLNKALKRSEQRTEQLVQKLKQMTEQSVILKKQVSVFEKSQIPVDINFDEEAANGNDDPFNGDVSSIMVKADMIDNFNIGAD